MKLAPEDIENILLRIDHLLSDGERLSKREEEFLSSLQLQVEDEGWISSYQREWLGDLEAKFGVEHG